MPQVLKGGGGGGESGGSENRVEFWTFFNVHWITDDSKTSCL